MTTAHDPSTLPAGIPAPVDDGAADHLTGSRLPSVELPATSGPDVDLSTLPGLVAVFVFPRTGRPGDPPLVPDWDTIPGARGCTVQTCAFRDLARDFGALDCRVLGLSAQDTDYQQEMAGRLHLPFPVLSDAELKLADAMRLPRMEVAGLTLLKRLGWIARDGQIIAHFYPVFPPDAHAQVMLDWLQSRRGTA